MRVEAGTSTGFHVDRRDARADAASPDFSALLASGTPRGGDAEAFPAAPDFSGMTRQDLFEWMNGEIRNGTMSLDDSSVFLGMTMKISASTGQAVDMATDTTRIDFIGKAQAGLEFCLSRFDPDGAERLHWALDRMQQASGDTP